MAERQLIVDQHIDEVWRRLQTLDTWEGIGGMRRLRSARHRDDGTLAGFAYSLDTPIGTIDDDAEVAVSDVEGDGRRMLAATETKGIRVRVELTVRPDGEATAADFVIDAEASNFLTRPLVATLRQTLDSGIQRESDRMAARLSSP